MRHVLPLRHPHKRLSYAFVVRPAAALCWPVIGDAEDETF